MIEKNKVHVWITSPPESPTESYLKNSLAILNQNEMDTYRRFRFDKDRYLYLAAHTLLRNALSKYADVKPENWTFQHNEYGKPNVSNDGLKWLRFNLSHTHGLAACVIVTNQEVGIDVERYDRIKNPMDIVSRYFSSQECEFLKGTHSHEINKRFIEIWTAKEAYIKAVGKGLSIPLDSFSVLPNSEGKIMYLNEVENNIINSDYKIFTLQPTPFHHLAVAIESKSQQSNESKLVQYIISS